MIVLETNALVDHATRREVRDRFGDMWEIDIDRLISWANANAIRVVLLPIVRNEAKGVLKDDIEKRYLGKRPRYEILQLYRRAEQRLDMLVSKLTIEDPAYAEAELLSEKKWWSANTHSLDHLVPGKDPMPDDGDIRIMIQCGLIATNGRVHVISRDAHFLGYQPELSTRYKIVAVHHGVQLPLLLNEWGG